MADSSEASKVEERLLELSEGWAVQLLGAPGEWVLTVTSRRGSSSHVYRGSSLARVVSAAWAGEPGGRV